MWCLWALAEGSMFCTNSSLGRLFNHFLASWTSLAILFNHFLASWTSLATVFVNILIVTTFCHSQVYDPTFAFGWVNIEIKSQPAFMIELKSSFFATIFAGKLFQAGAAKIQKSLRWLFLYFSVSHRQLYLVTLHNYMTWRLFSISQFLIGISVTLHYYMTWQIFCLNSNDSPMSPCCCLFFLFNWFGELAVLSASYQISKQFAVILFWTPLYPCWPIQLGC